MLQVIQDNKVQHLERMRNIQDQEDESAFEGSPENNHIHLNESELKNYGMLEYGPEQFEDSEEYREYIEMVQQNMNPQQYMHLPEGVSDNVFQQSPKRSRGFVINGSDEELSGMGGAMMKSGVQRRASYTGAQDNVAKEIELMPKIVNPKVDDMLCQIDSYKYIESFTDSEVHNLVERGPYELPDKSVYEGQWSKEGFRHGHGKCVWATGSMYEGNWENNLPEGHGRLIHDNGDMYEGYWSKGKAHGEGLYQRRNGSKYFGNWFNDKQHGFGKEKWPDESKYEGLYVNGRKDGHGKFTWPDGTIYQGSFKKNNIDGKGIMKWSDDRVYEGEWKENKMDGEGVFRWEDGREYKGQYKNDRKHGVGTFRYANGDVYEGEWAYGKQNGVGKMMPKNGAAITGRWNMGKMENIMQPLFTGQFV